MMKRLNQAISENASVTTLKSGSLALTFTGGRIGLTNPQGKLTANGKAYSKKKPEWSPPQSGYDADQNLTRVSD